MKKHISQMACLPNSIMALYVLHIKTIEPLLHTLISYFLRLLSQQTLRSANSLNIAAVGGCKWVWGRVVQHTARESLNQEPNCSKIRRTDLTDYDAQCSKNVLR